MRFYISIVAVLVILSAGAWWFYGNQIRAFFDPGYVGLSPAEEAARVRAIKEFDERASRPAENPSPGIRVTEPTGTSSDASISATTTATTTP